MIEEVRVERSPGGTLLVGWSPGGVDVVVSTGPTPDRLQEVARSSGDRCEVDAGPGHHYVGVAESAGGPVVIGADRRLPLEGALNLRDIGGYAGLDGRRVRWGRVFRSDALHALTEADQAMVAGLGLRTIYDLRRDAERERAPSRPCGEGVRSVVLAIGGSESVAKELMDQVLSGEVTRADDAFMVDEYRRMLDDAAGDFGRLLGGLAEPGALPALFHCTAGKDRTGVAAALLLLLLGVDRETVLDDYELTTRYRSERRMAELRPQLEAAGVDLANVLALLSARRPVLQQALERVLAEHGTVERYLVEAAGMTPATIDRLRDLLLT